MQLWHRMSLEHKSIVLFTGFILLALLNFLLINIFNNRIADDARIISLWQKEASGIEYVIGEAANNKTDEGAISQTEIEVNDFEDLLYKTLNGGALPAPGINLEPSEEKSSMHLKEIQKNWKQIKAALLTTLNAPATIDTLVSRIEEVPISDTLDIYTSKTVSEIRTIPNVEYVRAMETLALSFPEFKKSNEKFIDYLLSEYDNKRSTIFNVSLILCAFTVLILLILLYKIKTEVFAPLKDIIQTGELISRGNYNAKIEEKAGHELGKLGNLLNDTAVTFKNATTVIKEIGEGKIDSETIITTDDSEQGTIAGALSGMQQQMKQLSIEEKERNWISEGLTKFNDLLRSNDDTLEKLSDKFTAALVKYTGSLVGGTYLLNENDPPELELVALYALNTKKYNNKKFRVGEGLVGQTFLEEDYIYLLEIPENYISVTTGIGESSPKAILLVPLKIEDKVFGVIELASLREYQDYEIDFVRKLSENIAATIQSVKINDRTKKLLEESQEMTEQMRSQEEEMRQNMESVFATQDELSRKEKELSARLDAMNETVALAEYDLSMNLIHANKRFAFLHGYAIDELHGSSLKKFLNDPNEGQSLIDDLKAGNINQGEFIHKRKDGSQFRGESTFSYIKNDKGEPIKIIEVFHSLKEHPNVKSDSYTSEVEEELRINLEALEITRQKLSEKFENLQQKYDELKELVLIIETDAKGIIKNNLQEVHDLFGTEVKDLTVINGIKEDLFLKNDSHGEVNYNNRILKYVMKKMKGDSYLFLLMNI